MKLFLSKVNIQKWQWLYTPKKSAIGFVCRTGITSIIALYIALWMEMSSPFWAPLTVWMVALLTPEESNSKARWHLFGTLLGTIAAVISVAAFPQQAALFMICLAVWGGGCCFFAAFLNNFRIHGMRVASFTYTLIAIDAIPDPNQIFTIAMARASYIILAILLQKTATSICVGDQKAIRIDWLQRNLTQAINQTCFILSRFFQGDHHILEKNKDIFSTFYTLNQQSEFADMAIAPHSHLGAHGRMILSIANNILFKTFCLQKLNLRNINLPIINTLSQNFSLFFSELPIFIQSNANVYDILKKIDDIKENIDKQLKQAFKELLTSQNTSISQNELLFAELSIINNSLTHLEYMFIQFNHHTSTNKTSYSTYRINTYRNIKKAFSNGSRVFLAILFASCIWEITAWSNGPTFVMYVGIICAITSITDRPIIAAKHYFKGALYAIITTFFINFVLIPPVSDFEILTLIILPFMLIAGLASCSPPIALTGIAYNFLFAVLISFNNQQRINEITYFNLSFSLICGVIFTWITCCLIFPINDTKEYFFTCKQMILQLSKLSQKHFLPSPQRWIDEQISNLVYLVKDTKTLPKENQDIYFYGAQSIILIGLQTIQFRSFLSQKKTIPLPIQSILKSILYKIHTQSLFMNTQSINNEYRQIVNYLASIQDEKSKYELLPIFSSICILKSQLYYYEKFTRLFLLSQQKYVRL